MKKTVLGKKRKFTEFFQQNTLNNFVNIKTSKNKKISKSIENEEFSKLSSSRIQREFFMTDAVTLGPKLLGKILIRKIKDSIIKCRIVETEAYMGELDKGSHVHKHKKTERTLPFWNPGGHLYVYLIYGVNHCMNIIANDENSPQGCLIRAVEPLEGLDEIIKNRGFDLKTFDKTKESQIINLTNGPGKVASALCIDRSYNSVDLCNSNEIFLIHDEEYEFKMKTSPRINIDYAQDYKHKEWRFYISDNKFVSKPKFKKI
jgi:DNA-3-methyladenine glycosylase